MMEKLLRFSLLFALFLGCQDNTARAAQPVEPKTKTPTHKNNGAFLGHVYVSSAPFIQANFATMATHMQFDFATNRLFVICGGINRSGQLSNGAAAVPEVVTFLNAISAWEAANPHRRFQVFAYLSGSLSKTSSNLIDVSSPTVRANIAAESARFTSATVSGSYVTGAARTFDGIFIDLEPAGGTSDVAKTQFDNLTLLMDGVRSAIGPKKLTSFAAPKYDESSSSIWSWGPAFYYAMAGHVDVLVAMEYDSKPDSGDAYQSWIQAQTVSILKAVSGEYWTDGSHRSRRKGGRLLFAFPAYGSKPPYHIASTEAVRYAAPGVNAGLATLDARALRLFGAAIIYVTTDGTGADGYASYTKDWADFAKDW